MKSFFSQDFFRGNRAALRAKFSGTAPIVITAASALQKSGSLSYRFSQEANFWYLTGLDDPGLILVMDGSDEYLIAPTRSSVQETFAGRLTEQQVIGRSGLNDIVDHKEGWQRLGKRLKRFKHVASLSPPPEYVAQLGFYTNPARQNLVNRLKSYQPALELVDLSLELVRLRSIKQPAELKAINKAIEVTIDSMVEASLRFKSDRFEYEIEADLFAGIRRRGADGFAFDTIVAGGQHACTIHYLANSGKLKAGELCLIDVGAEIEHYSADISRAYSLSKATPRQRAVYQAVVATQDYAFSLLKPGLSLKQLERAVVNFQGKQLKALGLINIETEETIRRYYPHMVSHPLGLNVHDPADYDQPLAAGMVMTVEPGIYIPEEKLGIRLEDDVLITKTGYQNLTGRLARSLNPLNKR